MFLDSVQILWLVFTALVLWFAAKPKDRGTFRFGLITLFMGLGVTLMWLWKTYPYTRIW